MYQEALIHEFSEFILQQKKSNIVYVFITRKNHPIRPRGGITQGKTNFVNFTKKKLQLQDLKKETIFDFGNAQSY